MRRVILSSVMVVLGVLLGCGVALAAAGDTTRVSVSSSGVQGNNFSWLPSTSADGRFVAFYSRASNLVPGDTNRWVDAFVRDRSTGTTERVSVDSSGAQAEVPVDTNEGYGPHAPSISADGRFVAFESLASNLVPGDTNDDHDVFVHDRQTGTTQRVSLNRSGNQANGGSFNPSISADGRFVAFESLASNFAPNDTRDYDVFVRDRQTNITKLVSVNRSGTQGLGQSQDPSISADGRLVAFYSSGRNLVPGDTNADGDVFVRDLRAGTTRRVSVSSSGAQGNQFSILPSISAHGRFVGFVSSANNLVPGDTNHVRDVFVRDRRAGTTRRVSISTSGTQAVRPDQSPMHFSQPSMSADGRFVAFGSTVTNLVPGDTNGYEDVFVRDRQTGTTERVSVDDSGDQVVFGSNSCCSGQIAPSLSADGRFVAFGSYAINLVPGDTNDDHDVFVHKVRVDTKAPKVASVAPARGVTGFRRGADVKATFSERAYYVKSNFKLYRKGSGTPVSAVVGPVEGTANTKWVLNPNRPLRAGTTYVAKVNTGVVDKVGHHLDQRPNLSGKQPMKWTFKTRR